MRCTCVSCGPRVRPRQFRALSAPVCAEQARFMPVCPSVNRCGVERITELARYGVETSARHGVGPRCKRDAARGWSGHCVAQVRAIERKRYAWRLCHRSIAAPRSRTLCAHFLCKRIRSAPTPARDRVVPHRPRRTECIAARRSLVQLHLCHTAAVAQCGPADSGRLYASAMRGRQPRDNSARG